MLGPHEGTVTRPPHHKSLAVEAGAGMSGTHISGRAMNAPQLRRKKRLLGVRKQNKTGFSCQVCLKGLEKVSQTKKRGV